MRSAVFALSSGVERVTQDLFLYATETGFYQAKFLQRSNFSSTYFLNWYMISCLKTAFIVPFA